MSLESLPSYIRILEQMLLTSNLHTKLGEETFFQQAKYPNLIEVKNKMMKSNSNFTICVERLNNSLPPNNLKILLNDINAKVQNE